ncbi:hypothetical protein SLEP1_g15688 [Rubroshorea leprosula]|uniref:Uncharacterized protein n=1 Tax=Rubroshorea leprosula TaxID=152421 RepID=A0AAV5IU25_9ROSI|nr:hypothetical protein SLEP1_g15688 [Rubroshorea leprosula]
MGIKLMWQNTRRETITLGKNNHQREENDHRARARWRIFWTKITREKKKIFCSPGATFQSSYALDEYSQNFDQEMSWAEPDNLSRSFSARYANPSRIARRSHDLLL